MPQLIINPIQHRLQEQLLQRHQQLQDGILKQQQELNIIAEQLLLTSHLAVLQQEHISQPQQNAGKPTHSLNPYIPTQTPEEETTESSLLWIRMFWQWDVLTLAILKLVRFNPGTF